MAGRTKAFRNGYRDPNGIIYSTTRAGDQIWADATSPNDPEETSSAVFEHDPRTGNYEVQEGSLDLHPNHAPLGVGRIMHKIVNANFVRG